jgi:hypothetical protein
MNEMRSTLSLFLVLACAPLAGACGDDDHDDDDGSHEEEPDAGHDEHDGGSDLEGLQMCCYLGEICHEGSETNATFAECHDLGHENDPAACRADFDRCKAACDPMGETTLPEDCVDPSGDPH